MNFFFDFFDIFRKSKNRVTEERPSVTRFFDFEKIEKKLSVFFDFVSNFEIATKSKKREISSIFILGLGIFSSKVGLGIFVESQINFFFSLKNVLQTRISSE